MSRTYLHWFLLTFHANILAVIATNGNSKCFTDCIEKNYHYTVGFNKRGPPRMKHNTTNKNPALTGSVSITCLLCESNPPSTLTWYFNGNPMPPTDNREKVAYPCGEKLYISRLSMQDAGNYTCVAKNSRGKASFTTTIKLILPEKELPPLTIKPEGEVMGNDARIGSTINIECTVVISSKFKMKWSWRKDNKKIGNGSLGERIKWTREHLSAKNNHTVCITKLTITNITFQDTGSYECDGGNIGRKRISITAVTCFQGHYCPHQADTAKRCPTGTFSHFKNATSIDHCTKCPTHDRNETLLNMEAKNPKIAGIFDENCPVYLHKDSEQKPSLTTVEKVGVGIAVVVFLSTIVLIGWCGWKIWRRKKQSKLFQHSEHIDIDIPSVPLSHDVFVCYSSKNRTWVQDILLANLKAHDFRTFIDFIDFEVGVAIVENIVNAIYGSRKTVFVLSKDSIKSFYARTELLQALAAERTGRQVIVILYEKVSLPVEISSKVYLDWTDVKHRDQFWEKLYSTIRKPLDGEDV